jgi:cytochrome c
MTRIAVFIVIAVACVIGTLAMKQTLSSSCTLSLSDDAIRGRAWAPTCKSCHDISPIELDLKHSSDGPNLQKVYMSLAGTRSAPQPSTALQHPYPPLAAARDAGLVWTEENLFTYLRDPKGFLTQVTGQSFTAPFYMDFFIGPESQRRDVIAYLKIIKDPPECD